VNKTQLIKMHGETVKSVISNYIPSNLSLWNCRQYKIFNRFH